MKLMKEQLTFSDVLLNPQFSFIRSRISADVSTSVAGDAMTLGVISSNMDSVTGSNMSQAMLSYGAGACLHRFQSIDDNVKMLLDGSRFYNDRAIRPWVSIGLGSKELERAEALIASGATYLVIDVAHGASIGVLEQFNILRDKYRNNISVVVGNFANSASIESFVYHSKYKPDAFKVGIGGGSACTTREVTGCGVPSFSSLKDCVSTGYDIIQDGGIRNSGDFAKALAVGAKAVMVGRLLAGSEESPVELVYTGLYGTDYLDEVGNKILTHYGKKYRGSASAESYQVQDKTATHRAPEGESFYVPYTGPVKDTLQSLEAGLRSSMSYCNARNLDDFKENAEFITITNSGYLESSAYGKTNG